MLLYVKMFKNNLTEVSIFNIWYAILKKIRENEDEQFGYFITFI